MKKIKAIEAAKNNRQSYQLKVFFNDDTLKQLLARSRYLLFKHPTKWTGSQKKGRSSFSKISPAVPGLQLRFGNPYLPSAKQATGIKKGSDSAASLFT